LNLNGSLWSGYDASTTLNGNILNNNGTITSTVDDTVNINTKVLGGTGMEFVSDADMNINGMVGGGQTVNVDNGELNLGNPDQFFGHINLHAPALVDLVGLAPTSYDYSNDVLTLWNGNTPVDRLNVSGSGIRAYQYTAGSPVTPNGVFVSNNPYIAVPALPLHSMGV
jgi:hypothetical protein